MEVQASNDEGPQVQRRPCACSLRDAEASMTKPTRSSLVLSRFNDRTREPNRRTPARQRRLHAGWPTSIKYSARLGKPLCEGAEAGQQGAGHQRRRRSVALSRVPVCPRVSAPEARHGRLPNLRAWAPQRGEGLGLSSRARLQSPGWFGSTLKSTRSLTPAGSGTTRLVSA